MADGVAKDTDGAGIGTYQGPGGATAKGNERYHITWSS